MDYKARVSALLQNSVYQADIAILPPLEDLWSIHGMQRDPLSRRHLSRLCQRPPGRPSSRAATAATMSARRSSVSRPSRAAGSASVRAATRPLLLMEVESPEPPNAARIADFVAAGGRDRHREGAHKGAPDSAMPRRRMPV